MQFMHLFYEVYPAGDDPRKNRLSYPYAVRIPDKEKRIEFESMLENDGFERIVYENGYPVVYVNFTLKRFGNAVKAASSGTIDGGELHELDDFMNNIYDRYKTDETFKEEAENNYAVSAALSILGTVRVVIRNRNCSDNRFFDFARSDFEKNIAVVRDFLDEFK